jgi:hypothetical protein
VNRAATVVDLVGVVSRRSNDAGSGFVGRFLVT